MRRARADYLTFATIDDRATKQGREHKCSLDRERHDGMRTFCTTADNVPYQTRMTRNPVST
jgi:hypothetical protein